MTSSLAAATWHHRWKTPTLPTHSSGLSLLLSRLLSSHKPRLPHRSLSPLSLLSSEKQAASHGRSSHGSNTPGPSLCSQFSSDSDQFAMCSGESIYQRSSKPPKFNLFQHFLVQLSSTTIVTIVTLLSLNLLLPSLTLAEKNPPPALVTVASTAANRISLVSEEDFSVSREAPPVIVDSAKLLTDARLAVLSQQLRELEGETGWRLRVLTRSLGDRGPSSNILRDLWNPDENTLVVIEDLSSPNVLNFNTGDRIRTKLPGQFFLELQSRYGNQFFVAEEGELQVLLKTVGVISECLEREGGCAKVPGLVDELYVLTLITSTVGGAVFGFAARTPPSGRIEASWQWIAIFSPLWGILFLSFGVLPVISRTSDWVPLVKNFVGFLVGAAAIYLTPILGQSPIASVHGTDSTDREER